MCEQLRSVCAAHGITAPESAGIDELITLLEGRSEAIMAIGMKGKLQNGKEAFVGLEDPKEKELKRLTAEGHEGEDDEEDGESDGEYKAEEEEEKDDD